MGIDGKIKYTVQELLVALYLRLNGYLTSGYVIHSEGNGINGEVDVVAVRFPYHQQPETEHKTSAYLEVPDNIDVIVAEVKSNGQQPQFNASLRQKNNVKKLLSWVGLFEQESVSYISDEFIEQILPKENSGRGSFIKIPVNTTFGEIKVRPIVFPLIETVLGMLIS